MLKLIVRTAAYIKKKLTHFKFFNKSRFQSMRKSIAQVKNKKKYRYQLVIFYIKCKYNIMIVCCYVYMPQNLRFDLKIITFCLNGISLCECFLISSCLSQN